MMTVHVWRDAFPVYKVRMVVLAWRARLWMRDGTGLELVPKEQA